MKTFLIIFLVICSPALLALVGFIFASIGMFFSQVYEQSKKEKLKDETVTKTKFPFRLKLLFVIILSITILLIAAATVGILVSQSNISIATWITIVVCELFFVALSSLPVLLSFRTYEIINDEGIFVARLFNKKFVKYSEMKSYHYSFNQITVYNSEHKIIFVVADNRVGMKSLLNQLEHKSIIRE